MNHPDRYSYHFLVEHEDGQESQPSYDSMYDDDSPCHLVFAEYPDAVNVELLGVSDNYPVTSRNKTDRGHFYQSTVFRAMQEILPTFEGTVLDFGAGRKAIFAKKLSEIIPVNAYEYSGNRNENHVDLTHHDMIYASNVLNVQESEWDLNETLREIHENCDLFYFNYPQAPRKLGLTNKEMLERVGKYFKVERYNRDVYRGLSL